MAVKQELPKQLLREIWSDNKSTKLGMLIDPPNQMIEVTASRAREFERRGGDIILIGGSGEIENVIFQSTVESVVNATEDTPIIIFPGHVDQIPLTAEGIVGELNYRHIFGAPGYDFDAAFPPQAREYFDRVLAQRLIPSISTLYILCGDPDATVSKVSGILPVDLNLKSEQERVVEISRHMLTDGVDCIFLDSGSRATSSAKLEVVQMIRELINAITPETLLFVGGGISTPDQARQYKEIADCLSIGTYFENHGVDNVDIFLDSIRD